jgi:hypothetical protein
LLSELLPDKGRISEGDLNLIDRKREKKKKKDRKRTSIKNIHEV